MTASRWSGRPVARCSSRSELRDEFRGQKMGEGRKGWTFRLTFRSPERTLTSEEAQECQEAIVAALRARCGAELRGAEPRSSASAADRRHERVEQPVSRA